MATISPFKGILYQTNTEDINRLVAPPYDVVSKPERDAIVSGSAHNIFHLELPECDHATGCNDQYEHAHRLFQSWLKNGILEQDKNEAVYPYEISFSVNGEPHIRHGFIARLGIEPWEKRIVLPHEQTFDKVTEDRMKLLAATHAQFSQIFAVYRNNTRVTEALRLMEDRKEKVFSVMDSMGNRHTLYRLTDGHALAALSQAFAGMPVYIADGHHRYTTALRYWQAMQQRGAATRDTGFIATYLVKADDPGLIVLPTHRIITLRDQAEIRAFLTALRKDIANIFEISSILLPQHASEAELAHLLGKHLFTAKGMPLFGIIAADSGSMELWRLKKDSPGHKRLQELPATLAGLDVVAFNEIILDWCKKHLQDIDTKQAISYTADAAGTIRSLQPNQLLCCLRPTSVQDVLNVADAGLTMPHKATFFYPKILTGMVINQL
jgi:uncharacterized protein (DUF1015 family)